MASVNPKGFTLIELVMILVLIGIIAVFVAPKLGNVTDTKAGAFQDKLRADVRYAQNLAMTRNRRARMYFNGLAAAGATAPGAGYVVVIDGSALGDCSAFAATSNPAGGGNLTVTLAAGNYMNITVTPSMTCLEYDSLGRPYNCGAGPASCFSAASLSGMTITVRSNGVGVGTDITVTTQTGAVN